MASFTRALVKSMEHRVPQPLAHETFTLVVRPPGGTTRAKFYDDGSRLNGQVPFAAHNGWAFVAVGQDGAIVASAHGVPPPWIEDIPGTEAWGLLQAAMEAEPGSVFVDCKPCVDAIHRGRAWAE